MYRKIGEIGERFCVCFAIDIVISIKQQEKREKETLKEPRAMAYA